MQQEGHNNDWIYQDGPAPGPIKGSRSHYYNQWKWDSDPEMGGDFVAGANVPEEDLENENFVRARTLAYDFTIRIQEVGAHWFVASPSYCRWEQEVEKQECEDCPANTMSAAGATSCQECAPGSVSSPGAATCTQCEAGKYVGQGGGAVVRDEGQQCSSNSWLGQSSAM